MELEDVFRAWGREACSQEACGAAAGDDGAVGGDVVAVRVGDERDFARGGGIQPEAMAREEQALPEMDLDHAWGRWWLPSIDTIGVERLPFGVS